MASMYSIDEAKSISLYLYSDIKSHEWIKYQIVVEKKEPFKPKTIIFNEDTAEGELFFECYVEPEVPQLLEKIYSLLNFQISSFEFEPIDEKDFVLCAIHAAGKIKINLTLRFRKQEYKFTLFTDNEKLLLFAKNLKDEYDELINGKHALVKYSKFNGR